MKDADRWGRGKKRKGSVGAYSATEEEWNAMRNSGDLSSDSSRNVDHAEKPKKAYGSCHYPSTSEG